MKKLFTFIALAMSFMGGYAQGTFAVAKNGSYAVGQVVTSVPNLTITFSDSDSKFSDGKKGASYVDAVFSYYTQGTTNCVFNEGYEPSGCYYKFEPQYSGVLTVGIVLDKNRQLCVVGSDFKLISNFTYDLPSVSQGESQTLSEDNKLTSKSYGTVTLNVKAGETYYVLANGAKMGFHGVKYSLILATAASGFTTLETPFAVDYKSLDLTAYAIGLDETAKRVTYTEVEGIVPANTPVLVKGEASKTYSLAKAEGDAATVSTNLKVSDGTIEGDGSTIYAFGTKDGVSGFKIVRAGVKIPAKKGYLQLSSSSTGAKDFFAFGGETTGINNISANGIDEEETPLFNLAGQRVNKSYKGVVVKNGKKIVNK